MRRKAHTAVEVQLRSFLTSALHKANCRRHTVASLPRDGGPQYALNGLVSGSQSEVEMRKISCPCREQNHGSYVVQLVD